ncbi:TPA: helix-turn-helix transcriptional regulator [Streptococcus agalactiae]|nr:helix-turn-helix transcriptional regulator [Streptococcus agalactiae]HEO6700097.1 helix-turn-helix transcriptional regulator [Streptococcus agalactiae]HEO6719338.1 helix-turn-helix transcriptional regulator [Streptococcus agalactiae]HEO6727137.1 helix-turn-helix transcriptional regulator [Streptococcus agalactiae]
MENNVKILRKKTKKTMKELSKETGIGLSTISNYENGYSNPKKDNAKILADYFGVSVPHLLGYEKEPNLIKAEPIIPLELVQELSSINDKQEKILQEYLELGKREQVILKQIMEDL